MIEKNERLIINRIKDYNIDQPILVFCKGFFLLFFFFNSISLYTQTFPNSPQPWREEYNISLDGFTFEHPMTVINSDELQIIKYRIENRIEPQFSAYQILLAEAQTQLNFVPDPPETMNIMGGYEPNSNLNEMREWLWRNCHAAYTCGLAYAYSGEILYAEKAKEILMDWANKGTIFTGQDRGLQLGSWFSPMLYSADLIYYYIGWTESERTTFKEWWRNNCLLDGDVLDVMRRKDNNWKDAGLLGVFSAAVVFEDTLLLKEAITQLKSYFYSRTDDYVNMPGPGWKIKKGSTAVYLPREVIRNDGNSGLTYTAYALTTMVQCFEIARYCGFNFWDHKTQENTSLHELIYQYFKWDIKKEKFPWNGSPNYTDKRRNVYELANTMYNMDEEFQLWVRGNWPLMNGREGDEYITLNKGDILGSGISPPAAPSELSATTLSNREIELNWRDNSNNETGFNIERRTIQSSFFTVSNVDANSTHFVDKFLLSDSTTYIYRIKAVNDFTSSNYSNEFTVTTLPLNVFENNITEKSNSFSLFQNFPNPFNPTTNIKYKIPFSSNVKLIIYDILGNKIATLIDDFKISGSHNITVDASNFTCGIYIYRLITDSFTDTKKMIFIK